jgi:hypothetical protein
MSGLGALELIWDLDLVLELQGNYFPKAYAGPFAQGENGAGIRILFCCVSTSGCTLAA